MQNLHHASPRSTQINLLKFLHQSPAVEAVVAFGSWARGDADYLSDTDLAIVFTPDANIIEFRDAMRPLIQTYGWRLLNIPRKNSLAIFDQQLHKVDLLLCENIEDLTRNFLGSSIPAEQVADTIWLDKTGRTSDYLPQLDGTPTLLAPNHQPDALIEYFLLNFETCSRKHARSDGYGFYFNYNIALHTLAQLNYVLRGNQQYVYSPRQFIYRGWDKKRQSDLYALRGTIFLPEANQQKRRLLEAFYQTVEEFRADRLEEARSFCEQVYLRDSIWNLRDYALHAPHILSNGKLYRSSSLSLQPEAERSNELLKERNIKTIIDLRAPDEVAAQPYRPVELEGRSYVKAPMDPYHQPEWFQREDHSGRSSRAIAYHFFLRACQSSWQTAVHTILESEDAVLVHCFAGKDRTGLLIGAIQLLLGVDRATVRRDYLASGSDSDLAVFDLLFQTVDQMEGIDRFFTYQGIDVATQSQLRRKLL